MSNVDIIWLEIVESAAQESSKHKDLTGKFPDDIVVTDPEWIERLDSGDYYNQYWEYRDFVIIRPKIRKICSKLNDAKCKELANRAAITIGHLDLFDPYSTLFAYTLYADCYCIFAYCGHWDRKLSKSTILEKTRTMCLTLLRLSERNTMI